VGGRPEGRGIRSRGGIGFFPVPVGGGGGAGGAQWGTQKSYPKKEKGGGAGIGIPLPPGGMVFNFSGDGRGGKPPGQKKKKKKKNQKPIFGPPLSGRGGTGGPGTRARWAKKKRGFPKGGPKKVPGPHRPLGGGGGGGGGGGTMGKPFSSPGGLFLGPGHDPALRAGALGGADPETRADSQRGAKRGPFLFLF